LRQPLANAGGVGKHPKESILTLPSTATGKLTIDLGALQHNWRLLDAKAAPARAAAVIKANGYGLGIERVASALQSAGCRMFFVANPDEGARARAVLPAETAIYVLNGLQPHADAGRDYAAHGLRPVIGGAEELQRLAAFNAESSAPLPFALHLDTGMNRLGFENLGALEAAVARHGLRGADLLMSHFVSAESPSDPINALQMERFAAARARFAHLPAALANSSGIFLPGLRFDWARAGYALYAGNPTPGAPNPMRAVVALDILIQQTRWIEAGETCGYNGLWTARRRTRLATLLAGYADGLPFGSGGTDAKSGASALIAGIRCPLVGRISMDLLIADVTDVPEPEVGPGAWARLFGPEIALDTFAKAAGTIGYQVLTTLGARYARVIKEPASPT
jgi:alanine racemase